MRLFHTFLHFLYVVLASWALGFFSCVEITPNVYVMRKSPSITCFEGQHLVHLPYYIAGVIVYVIGLPTYYSFMYIVLYQTKFKTPFLLSIKELVHKLLLKNRSVYKADRQYIISAQLFLKLVILLALNFILTSVPTQGIIIFLAIGAYFIFLLHFKPYKERYHLIIDYLCQLCCILTICCGILFYVNEFERKQEQDRLTFITIAITVLFLIFASMFMVKDIMKAILILKDKSNAPVVSSSQKLDKQED